MSGCQDEGNGRQVSAHYTEPVYRRTYSCTKSVRPSHSGVRDQLPGARTPIVNPSHCEQDLADMASGVEVLVRLRCVLQPVAGLYRRPHRACLY